MLDPLCARVTSDVHTACRAADGTEAELLGSWNASRDNGSRFELTVTESGEFTWAYGKDDEKQEIKGVFVVDDGVLAMEPDSGGVMLANVSKPTNNRFTFQQNGTSEKSIIFQKQ